MLLAILTAHFTYRNGDICSIETVELFWHLALYPWAQFWYTMRSISEHPCEWSIPIKYVMPLNLDPVVSIHKMRPCMTPPPSSIRGPFVFRS